MSGKPTSSTKKTIRTFAAASFLNDLGSDMIYPVWPLFVTSFTGANMAVLGFIDGLGDAIVSLSQAFSGYLSDRLQKRKIFIVIGYMMGALSRVGYALSTSWQHLIPIRILDRAGKIRSAPRDAVVADLSTDGNRGSNFGLLRAMDNLGALVGVILSIILFRFIGYKAIFLLAAIPSVAASVIIFSRIKENRPAEGRIFKGIRLKDLNRDFRIFLFLSVLFALASFSYSFLLIYARDSGFAEWSVPVLYLVFTAFAFLGSIPFGKLSDRIGRKKVLQMAFVLWVGVCLLVVSKPSTIALIAVFVLYGLHRGALETVQRAFVAELCPAEFRASSLGGYQMVIGLCALPGSLIAGILWEKIGIYAPFYFSLALTAAAFLTLSFVRERRPERK